MNRFTKNKNPSYYFEHESDTNCGSYALNIEEWYEPIEDWDYDEPFLESCIQEGEMSEKEALAALTEEYVKVILRDFDGEIRRLIDINSTLNQGEELVVFRLGAEFDWFDSEVHAYNFDFHFRVQRGGRWLEKLGSEEIVECNCTTNVWENGDAIYNGPIVYFAHQTE